MDKTIIKTAFYKLHFFTICLFIHGLTPLNGQKVENTNVDWKQPTNKWVVSLHPDSTLNPNFLQFLGITNLDLVTNLNNINSLDNVYLLDLAFSNLSTPTIADYFKKNEAILRYEQLFARQMVKKNLNDPMLATQWHLNNTGQGGGNAGVDVNIFDAWNLGYDGSGAQICIIDDGLEISHPDLAPNFQLSDSKDLNGNNGNDPSPSTSFNGHGTACAGVAAAKGGNNIGVAGAAPNVKLAGIRLIARPHTDADEASAFGHRPNNNDIYSNSWGPPDFGVYEQPEFLAKAALKEGAMNGRDGLGSIYVWAAGNGRINNDNTNYDGWVNSIYTIGIGAHSNLGLFSDYSEPGASMLVTAPSSGGTRDVTTTAINSGYTNSFGGTSAATPLVSGIIALMLDANPNLTWRDIQHLLVENAEIIDADNVDWQTNGVGKSINHSYGFGAVNAESLVNAAISWDNVDDSITDSTSVISVAQVIPDGRGPLVFGRKLIRTFEMPKDISLEHVELKVNFTHTYRGDLRVKLISPSGTESILANQHNDSTDDLLDWYYMSVRYWGESSKGRWTIEIDDGYIGDEGVWNDFQLIFHGIPVSRIAKNTFLYLDENGEARFNQAQIDLSLIAENNNLLLPDFVLPADEKIYTCEDVSDTAADEFTIETTDDLGKRLLIDYSFFVLDTLPPIINHQQNLSIYLDENGEVSLSKEEILIDASDNCLTQQETFNAYTLAIDDQTFDCEDIGIHTITLQQNQQNLPTLTTTITVMDTITVKDVIAQDIVLFLDEDGQASLQTSNLTFTNATDNCYTTDNIIANYSIPTNFTSFDCTKLGEHHFLLDKTNNDFPAVSLKVTVIDELAPVINCETEEGVIQSDCQSIETMIAGCEVDDIPNPTSVAELLSQLPTLSILNNCGSLSLVYTDGTLSTVDACSKRLTRTINISDAAGNTTQFEQHIILIDTTAPIPSKITFETIEEGCSDTELPLLNTIAAIETIGGLSITDNCKSVDELNINIEQNEESVWVIGAGKTYTRNYLISDGCNSATITHIAHIRDLTLPIISCSDITVHLDSDGIFELTDIDLIPFFQASDNCNLINSGYQSGQTSYDCNQVGQIFPITFFATDNYGNKKECNSMVTVIDTILPTAISKDITITITGNAPISIVPSDIDNGSTDNCSVANISIDQSIFDCNNIGQNTITLSVEDSHGNINYATSIVTIEAAPESVCFLDSDGDDVPNYRDFCFGNDSSGDSDLDGICDDKENEPCIAIDTTLNAGSMNGELIKVERTLATNGLVEISKDEIIIFQAGTSISLKPGFSATGNFKARIESCDLNNLETRPLETRRRTFPKDLSLKNQLQINPNPIQQIGQIKYQLPQDSEVYLTVMDLQGNIVMNIINGLKKAEGNHEISFDVHLLPTRMYLLMLKTKDGIKVEKFIVSAG